MIEMQTVENSFPIMTNCHDKKWLGYPAQNSSNSHRGPPSPVMIVGSLAVAFPNIDMYYTIRRMETTSYIIHY